MLAFDSSHKALKVLAMSRQVSVGSADELLPGGRKLAFAEGRSIVLFNIGGTVHAIDNSCPHNGASLASGRLEGNVLRCPAHGLGFDVTTGCMPGAGGMCLTKFPVHVEDDRLVLTISDPSPAGLSTCQASG
jgi:3-phenylpropionate/trans-cinnamate dioxygenase ferredoxin subunit